MAQTINGSGVIDIKNQSYVIKGGKGDDTIIGGNGNDTITGGKGTNTIIYGIGDGNDVYNLTKGENLIIQLEGVRVGEYGYNSIKAEYAPNKKDIYIYVDYENNPNEYLTIKNFADKDQTNSAVIRFGKEELNLKECMFYTEANADFTGTALNDEIDASGYYVEGQTAADRGLVLNAGKGSGNQSVIGSDYSDTIYAGDLSVKNDIWAFNEIDAGDGNDVIVCAGANDIISGGKGNDTITAGAGWNEIVYFKGDGHDVVNLTKGEQLCISFKDDWFIDSKMPNIGYEKAENGKDLIVWVNKDNHDEGSITIKDFITKDITNNATKKSADTSYVVLNYLDAEGNEVNFDLRKDLTLLAETTENFTGTWLNDKIDASKATEGLKLNGGNGNDTIIGGAGKDTITGGTGENTVVYGKGSGNDIVNLTKGEKLTVELTGIDKFSDVKVEYATNKKDVLIYADKNNADEYITLKNYATNSTAKNSTVELLVNGKRKDLSVFTETDKNFTGTILDDEINAKNAILYKTVKVDGKKVQVEKADTDKGLTLNGGAGNDTIIGTRYSDTLKGGDGDDVIKSVKGDGNDVMYGGNGDDTIEGGNGNDKLYGDNGDDSISGGNGNDTIYGGNGNDSINGGNDNDKLYGDAGNDTIQGGGGNDTIYGGKGDDSIEGGNDDDLLYGEDGNDTINGGNGNDTIYGGKGNDSINGGTGDDILYGGDGDDTLIGGSGIDTYYGGAGNDYIKSVNKGEYADGGDGNDYIEISGGTAVGGKGNDTIMAYSGEGIVKFDAKSGHDTYINYKGNANDTLVFEKISSKQLSYEKSGDDLVIKYNKNTSVTVQDYFKEGNNPAEWGTYVQTKDGKELLFDVVNEKVLPAVPEGAIKGTVGYDELSTSGANSLIYGFYGNDTITASGGASTIYGGEGDDVITANGGASVVYGGDGNDTISSGGAKSTIYGGKGDDVIKTNSYISDVLVFENGDGNDVIEETVKLSRNSEADIIKLTGVDKDGFTQKISGNDLVISYNKDENGIFQDSITIKDFLKNPDDIPNYKIVTNDGYESTANLEYLKEEVTSWLNTYVYDDVASGLADNNENAVYELYNTFMNANNEQSYAGSLL